MAAVQIVCDSTADLDPAFRGAHGITVVPLKVIFGGEVYEDGITIQADSFYARMRAGETPRTSQPTPAEFEAVFRAVPETTSIVCTTISADLSGTYASATQARAALPGRNITVIDTRTASVGHHGVVRAAVAAAEAGGDAARVAEVIRRVIETQQLLFTVETLEYLRRGGRIGGARALVGSMLDIKPILAVKDGVIEPVDRVRTYTRALERIVGSAANAIRSWGGKGVVILGEAGLTGLLDRLIEQTHAAVPDADIHPVVVGPVIGTHGGPGAVGLAFHPAVQLRI